MHQELTRGVAVRFGKRLALDPREGIVFTGFFGKRLTLPFSEVESTGTERALLVIRRYGQNKPWRRVHARAVPNLGVFQKIVAQATIARQAPPQSENFTWTR